MQKYKTNWGGFNILKTELYLIKEALRDDCNYIHLISGQDYPIKSLAEFKYFFEKENTAEYIEYKSLPRHEWEVTISLPTVQNAISA